jgi:hypothetical protein
MLEGQRRASVVACVREMRKKKERKETKNLSKRCHTCVHTTRERRV